MKKFLIIPVFLIFINGFSQQNAIPENVLKDWETLTEDGGQWVTYDNTDGYDAYGMRFTWGLGKKTVNIILFAIKNRKSIGTLFEYKIYYHPTEKKVILEQFGSDGTVGIGEIKIFDSLKSENISTFYSPDGSIFKLKHQQGYKGGIKTSQTYVLDDKGEWVKSRYYEWKRTKEIF